MAAVDDFIHAVAEIGIRAVVTPGGIGNPDVAAADAVLSRGVAHQRFTVFLNRPSRLDDVTRLPQLDRPVMLFTAFVQPRTAAALRNAGVQYLDRAGNAWDEFGDVLIDIRGRSRPATTAGQLPRVVASNIFSANRAQVAFALLAWPDLWSAPRRALAEAAGVSVGLAQDTIMRLLESGLDREAGRPGLPSLLDRWTMAFPTGLAKRLTLAAYRGDISSMQNIDAGRDVFVSGEAAAEQLLRPASAVFYVKHHDSTFALSNRWRTDGIPNIIVRRKFWHAPRDGVQAGSGVSQAPWPLVYADLATSDDPRVRGAASEWKNRFSDAG